MQLRPPALFASCLASAFLVMASLTASAKDSPQNEKILKATDPFEGLAEAALSGSDNKVDAAVKSVQKSRVNTRTFLSSESAGRYDELFGKLETAQAKHDNIEVSMQGAELYKLLVSSLDASALTIPKEVSLLDYCGFRISLLLQTSPSGWGGIADTVKEANGYWTTIRDRVTDEKLQKKMDKAQEGLAKSAQDHDAKLGKSSVKQNLDLVDDLENYFSHK